MAAPIGNQFWKIRSIHGTDILFDSPELLWEAACEYFEWCDSNPLEKAEAKVISNGSGEGSSVEIVKVPVIRPYTKEGLYMYLGCGKNYFENFKKSERAKKQDFKGIISQIEKAIYNQKFSGAASGLFNANIIARDLGLSEKTHVENTGTQKVVLERRVVKRQEKKDV